MVPSKVAQWQAILNLQADIQRLSSRTPPGFGRAPTTIMALGDSNTSGLLTSTAKGGWPAWMVLAMRAWRSNFEMVASQIILPATNPGCSVPWNEGHGGLTIAQINAAFPGYIATLAAPPQVVCVMLGTNDIVGGRTLAQMQADFATLFATMKAQGCGVIVCLGPPPIIDGSGSHANLAALQALQIAFTQWLQNTFAPLHGAFYSGASQLPGNGNYLIDGEHLSQEGEQILGQSLAEQLDATILPGRFGDTLPRRFMKEPLAGALQLATVATDNAVIAGHAGFNPGSGSFSLAFDFYPTAVGAGGFTIATYGVNGTPPYYTIVRSAAALGLLINAVGIIATGTIPVSQTFGDVPGLQANQWHRIVLVCDATHGEVALYINAQLSGMAQNVAPWAFTQQTFYLGAEPVSTSGAVGYYSRVQMFKGLPGRCGSVALLQMLERDYYLHGSIAPKLGTAYYTLDNSPSDTVYFPGDPNPDASLGGGATILAANTSVPARPWEYAGGSGNLGPGV